MKKAHLFPLNAVRLLPGILKDRQEVNNVYLLEKLSPERMFAPFRKQAGLPPQGERYGGWESKDIAGHAAGHYLSALATCYAACGDERALERVKFILNELELCQRANADGYVAPVDKKCFEELRNGKIETTNFSLNKVWVPFYTIHKIFAGLRDAYRLCGQAQALNIAIKLAGFFRSIMEKLNDAQITQLQQCEYGGMNEVLCDLAEDSGDAGFRHMARRCFCQKKVLDPLKQQCDELNGLHGNTLIPKVIGLSALYNAEAEESDKVAAEFFFERVTRHRSFANGGHGESEHFFEPGTEEEHLTPYTAETCNSYNMLKLAEFLFEWSADPEIMDFAERVLLNHVAANIGERPGEFGYFIALNPVAVKVFSTPYDSFWCCVGTGMESPTRYAKTIYAYNSNTLFINQFFASQLDWSDKNAVVKMLTDFPESSHIRIEFTLKTPAHFKLCLRNPAWCPEMKFELNSLNIQPEKQDKWLVISRQWNNGDILEFNLNMPLYTEPLPGSDRIAIFSGPVLLAGCLPTGESCNDPAKERFSDHLKARGKTDEFPPVLIGSDTKSLLDGFIRENKNEFSSPEIVRPFQELRWKPFYRVYEEHYGVYFRLLQDHQWKEHERTILLEQEQEKMLSLLTTDTIMPGFQQSEVEHDFAGENTSSGDLFGKKYRELQPGGSCSYLMAVDSQTPMELKVTFWGGEWSNQIMLFSAEGSTIARQQLRTIRPGDWCCINYAIPAKLSCDKNFIRIEISLLKANENGRFFGLQTMKRKLQTSKTGSIKI